MGERRTWRGWVGEVAEEYSHLTALVRDVSTRAGRGREGTSGVMRRSVGFHNVFSPWRLNRRSRAEVGAQARTPNQTPLGC